MRIVLKVSIGTCVVRDVIEIPDREWAEMSEADRSDECESYLEGHISNSVDAWWEPVDDE